MSNLRFLATKPLLHQYNFIHSRAKYTALVAGLGSGKTEALVYKTLKFLTMIPNARIGIYEPTVDLIKRIIYPRFEDIFATSGIKFKLNKSDGVMSVWLPTGKAEIIFRSMDNYTRIIGYETHHAILDEIDTIPKDKAFEVWIRVLARNRKKFMDPYDPTKEGMNTVGITTTPEGFNFVYELWVKQHKDNPDYELIRGKTADNFFLPEDYIDSLRRTYPPQLISAYLNGEFVNLVGNTVYSGFDRTASHTPLTIHDFPKHQVIHIGMDFNVDRAAATVFMKGDENMLYCVDEFHHVKDTKHMIKQILRKFPDRQIIIYPDASGRSRKSVDASKSDIKLLREAGFKINAPKRNPPVRQRVVSVNTLFLNGQGERKLLINTTLCPFLTESLERQVYLENGDPEKDSSGMDDILDSMGYCVDRVNGLARPTATVGRMRMWAS